MYNYASSVLTQLEPISIFTCQSV